MIGPEAQTPRQFTVSRVKFRSCVVSPGRIPSSMLNLIYDPLGSADMAGRPQADTDSRGVPGGSD